MYVVCDASANLQVAVRPDGSIALPWLQEALERHKSSLPSDISQKEAQE